MAAPSTLSVGVDLEEYSRFEPDKNTIRVSLLPGVPRTDVKAASLAGASSIDVNNAGVFTAAPFNVYIGTGSTQEYVTVLSVAGAALNLAAPLVYAHVECEAVVKDVNLVGEVVVLQLIKA